MFKHTYMYIHVLIQVLACDTFSTRYMIAVMVLCYILSRDTETWSTASHMAEMVRQNIHSTCGGECSLLSSLYLVDFHLSL